MNAANDCVRLSCWSVRAIFFGASNETNDVFGEVALVFCCISGPVSAASSAPLGYLIEPDRVAEVGSLWVANS